jgi:hypothetical protein
MKVKKQKQLKIMHNKYNFDEADVHLKRCSFPYFWRKVKTIEDLKEELKEIESKIDSFKREMASSEISSKFCHKAFVIFSARIDVKRILEKSKIPYLKKKYYAWRGTDIRNRGYRLLKYNRTEVKFQHSPAPTDIFWENLATPRWEKLVWLLISFILSVIILGIGFGLLFPLENLKKDLGNSDKKEKRDFLRRFIFIWTSLIVIGINFLLSFMLRWLSKYEKHQSVAQLNVSITVKLSIFSFLNTAFIPLMVNLGKNNWFSDQGLFVDITYNMAIVCFLTPIWSLVNPLYLYNKMKRWLAIRKGAKSLLTQQQANELFEPPDFDLPEHYANTVLIFWISLFYLFPCPIISLFACGGSFLQYWIEKWLLLKRSKKPKSIGEDIVMMFVNFFPFIILLYPISLIVFEAVLFGIPKFGLSCLAMVGVLQLFKLVYSSEICWK